MAASTSATNTNLELIKEVRSHEVAIAELSNLSSSRAVYQKNGNLFFRTTVQKATASEQKQLDSAKAKLEGCLLLDHTLFALKLGHLPCWLFKFEVPFKSCKMSLNSWNLQTGTVSGSW